MPRDERATQHAKTKEKNDKNRKLKSEYRNLTEKLKNDGEDLADYTKTTLQDRVRHLNELSEKVERPSEQADDSEAFFTLTQRGAEMAKRVTAGKGRSAKDFIRHLKAAYVHSLDAQQDGFLDPTAFMRVRRLFKYAPGVSCLLGPLDAAPKVRKVAQRVQRKPVGEVVAPEVLKADEQQENRETERNMDQMWAVLKIAPPEGLGLMELVLNHESFAQTAENLFTLSFLVLADLQVHNKRARIVPEEVRGLVVHPHKPAAKDTAQQQQQDKQRMQFIIGFTMGDWEKWKRYVAPSACLTETRQDTTDAAGPSRTHQEDGAAEPAGGASRKPSKGRSRKTSSQAQVEDDDENDEDEGDEEDDEDAPQRKRRGRKH